MSLKARSSRAQDHPLGPLRETPPGPHGGGGGQPLAWTLGRGTTCPWARSWVRAWCGCCCFFWLFYSGSSRRMNPVRVA